MRIRVLHACFAVVRISSLYLPASGFFVVFVGLFQIGACLRWRRMQGFRKGMPGEL